MYKFNFNKINNLFINSFVTQKEICTVLGLPEKYFSRLKEDGSNIKLEDLSKIANYFNLDINWFFTDEEDEYNSEIIQMGKSLFEQYDVVVNKLNTIRLPDPDGYKSPLSDTICVQTSNISSSQMNYIISAEKYNVLMQKRITLDYTLNQVVCDLELSKEAKRKIKLDIFNHLVLGLELKFLSSDKNLLCNLSNKACISAVNQFDLLNLLSDKQKDKLEKLKEMGD